MCVCEHMSSQFCNPLKQRLLLSHGGKVKDEHISLLINAGLLVSKFWILIICSIVHLLELMSGYARLRILQIILCKFYSTFRNILLPIGECT
jgi:hypothetical protein